MQLTQQMQLTRGEVPRLADLALVRLLRSARVQLVQPY